MERKCTREEAANFLSCLIGEPFNYGLKSPDMDLYDLGFGADIYINKRCGRREVSMYAIHHTTAMEVYWNDRTVYYDWDTPHTVFHTDIQKILGLRVQRVALSDKNDLWIDLGKCHIVIITLENNKESWRFFSPAPNSPHLVASDLWTEIDSYDGEESD